MQELAFEKTIGKKAKHRHKMIKIQNTDIKSILPAQQLQEYSSCGEA